MRVVISLGLDDVDIAQEIAEFVESALEESQLSDYVIGVFRDEELGPS